MPIYLYCLLSTGTPPPPATLLGLDDAPVRAIAVGAIDAWVSDVAEGRFEATVARARAHDAVCAAALEAGNTPLPGRFGQIFADDDVCRTALASRAERLAERLHWVARHAEMRIVLRFHSPELATDAEALATSITPGTQYLDQLRRRSAPERRGRELSGLVRARMASTVRADRIMTDARRPHIVTVAHLVARVHLDQYRAVVADIMRDSDGSHAVVGPTAPYSFATVENG